MRAVIPVAGVGSRLRPHTFTLPKVLLNVAGKPILGHILEELQRQNITDCTIVVGYMAELVQEYVTKNFDLNVKFVHQEERRGLGHSIWLARDTFQANEQLLIILGDTIFDMNLKNIASLEYSSLGVKQVEDPRRFGVAEVGNDGFIQKLVEKPDYIKPSLALVGIYNIMNSKLLTECLQTIVKNDLRTRGEYQLTDALELMIQRGEKFTTFPVEGWYDCGKYETILETNRYLLERDNVGGTDNDNVIISPSYISPTAQISRSVIGPYATIADGAIVQDSIVKNSIISDGATVQQSTLDSSIVGNNAIVRGNFRRINVGDSSEIDFSSH